jgi:hypothetical protein
MSRPAARAGGISAGEFVRRAVEAYDSDTETAELRTLLDAFAISHAETLRRLDDSERKLDDTLAALRPAAQLRKSTRKRT